MLTLNPPVNNDLTTTTICLNSAPIFTNGYFSVARKLLSVPDVNVIPYLYVVVPFTTSFSGVTLYSSTTPFSFFTLKSTDLPSLTNVK